MKIYPLLVPVVFLPLASFAEPTVSIAGLQVVYDTGEKEFDGFKTYNMDKGHSVTLLVRSEEKPVVRVNEDDVEMTIGGAEAESSFFSGMGFSDDKKAVRIEFRTEDAIRISADGSLAVQGTLPVAIASGKKSQKSAPFEVKEGEAIVFDKAGERMPKLKIKKVDKPQFGDDELEIEFSTNRKMDDFAGVSFTDKNGKLLESDRRGSSWMGFGGKGSGSVSYSFKKKPSDLIMVLEDWTGLEEKDLKIDLSVKLGGK